MRRLLLGLFMLGSIVLSSNDAVAAPRLVEVTVSCQQSSGEEFEVQVSGLRANDRVVQILVQEFHASADCETGTIRVTVRPLP